ncbi:MAG TPA: IclR family transcriptional regulator [Solirubrobacteraceae bacterium]|jgi:IclR family pca regulon transcriptional regulator|nr:IclR family transcriptional regulator [Solirubrobacteraceae bacterium]
MARGKPDLAMPDGEWALSTSTLKEPRFSQSLERGLAILCCFDPEHPVLGIVDIAQELGMSRSTTHRYVVTLAALGYLEQGPGRKYHLGLRVTGLGLSTMSETGLREHALADLQELCQRTGFTVSLAILDGPEILLVERLRGARRILQRAEPEVGVGSRLPAHCTAAGKLLLAYLPEPAQRELVGELQLERRGPNTIKSKSALRTELAQIREDGLAVDDQEYAEDLYAIAAPLRSDTGDTVAAVAMTAHNRTIDLADLIDALGPHLISTADRISARLGYRRADELHSADGTSPSLRGRR